MHLIGIQKFLRLLRHLPAVDIKLTARLSSQKNILGNRHIRDKHQFLMHNRNAGVSGRYDTVDIHLLTLDQNFSLLRMIDTAENFYQGGLAGAVLPQKSVHLSRAKLQLYIA